MCVCVFFRLADFGLLSSLMKKVFFLFIQPEFSSLVPCVHLKLSHVALASLALLAGWLARDGLLACEQAREKTEIGS